MMNVKQGVYIKSLRLHEKALVIDDAFEIDEYKHARYSIIRELRFHDIA